MLAVFWHECVMIYGWAVCRLFHCSIAMKGEPTHDLGDDLFLHGKRVVEGVVGMGQTVYSTCTPQSN